MSIDPERLAGCLLGQCLGDAMGFRLEGGTPAACERHVGEMQSGEFLGREPFPFGQYTDDSQLAREMLQSVADRGGFDPADYARRIAAIFSERRIVGRGQATTNAAVRIAAGVDWEIAGEPAPSAGNGSAMRAGPVGILASGDTTALTAMAVDQGRITHRDPRCGAGSVAIAGAVMFAVEESRIEPVSFSARLSDLVAPVHEEMGGYVRRLGEWVGLSPKEAYVPIRGAGVPEGFDDGWWGISPYVVSSVLWSLYAFLRSPDDYLEAVYTAIAVGGDVDTTAAMTGAIAGARAGLSGLPAQVREVQDRGGWGYEELVALCRRVAR